MTGTFKFIPSTLALIAVHRQSAASKSAKPLTNAQHSLEGGVPTVTLTSPKMSAQTPSFNVSLGHEALGGEGGEGGGQLGFGVGGVGFGVGGVGLGVGGVGFGVGGVGFGVGGGQLA